jgi:hypothetical protein
MDGLGLIGTICATVFVIALVLRDARSRHAAEIRKYREADEFANVVREDVMTKKRMEAIRKMRRHKIKPITDPKRKWASSAHEATTLRKSADVVAIKGGRA